MQIRQILKPCVTCGESLIFGHFAPEGDIEPNGDGMSRVRCPSCRAEGPLSVGFREACHSWNALALPTSEPLPAMTPTDEIPNNPWPIHSSIAPQPVASSPPL